MTVTRMLIAALLLWIGAGGPGAGDTRPGMTPEAGYRWTQLTTDAGYPKSYNYQMFADSGVMRVFHHTGVWSSTDGASWRKTGLADIVRNQGFMDYVRFNGYIYGLGTFEGNIERHTQTTQIARTKDLRTWEIVAAESSLPKRYFYHPFEFRWKLWIIGGADDTAKYADAWVSDDAVRWTKAADNLPFGKRAGQHFLVFGEKLYMLDYDAWVSTDGLEWKLLTPKITGGEIFGYSPEVFDGKMWLIACNRSGTFGSEVLTSADGITWTAQRAPWSPRGGVATCVFRGRLIMTGGKYGGPGIAGQTEFVYSNDVWSLERE